jgi:hypothetical protein
LKRNWPFQRSFGNATIPQPKRIRSSFHPPHYTPALTTSLHRMAGPRPLASGTGPPNPVPTSLLARRLVATLQNVGAWAPWRVRQPRREFCFARTVDPFPTFPAQAVLLCRRLVRKLVCPVLPNTVGAQGARTITAPRLQALKRQSPTECHWRPRQNTLRSGAFPSRTDPHDHSSQPNQGENYYVTNRPPLLQSRGNLGRCAFQHMCHGILCGIGSGLQWGPLGKSHTIMLAPLPANPLAFF